MEDEITAQAQRFVDGEFSAQSHWDWHLEGIVFLGCWMWL